jgi:outer membrane receptor protein involved in Fe transport
VWLLLILWAPTVLLSQPQTSPKDDSSKPEPIRTSITVVEQVETEAPALITVLGPTEVRQQPGVNVDDRLRAIPGFTLFRRTSSIAANPTTQGVSLRGLGSSGASRSLVLWDGIPVNDPFGGWVYWTRISPEEVDRVELSRGAATSVFGDRAMSGAISLFSQDPEPLRLTAAYEAGNKNTHVLTGGMSHLWQNFGVSALVRAFTTDGYYVVREDRRGAADTRAGVRFVSGVTRLDYLGAKDRMFVKLDILAEERANGTVLTANSTGLGTLAGHYTRTLSSDTISVLGYHTRQQYRASFSAVSADRNTERITFLQTVPAEAVGGAALWRHRGSVYNLLAGADAQRVEGTSTDVLVPTGIRVGGGSQLQHGTFVQLDAGSPSARVFVGARHQFTGQDNRFFSPSGGFTVGRRLLRARGSVYRAFRAPTLNELFRDFRVGNAETRANAFLRPETLFGAELGADMVGENARLGVSLYRNQIDNVITNVTLSSTPALIVRQRQNAAAALTRGIDAQAEYRRGPWRFDLGYLFADSRFTSGERIPQVPKHAANAQLTYAADNTLVSGGLRSFGLQFEDDRNQFILPGFATLQLSARQRLKRSLWATLAIENLLDREFLTGFSPTPLIGAPLLWRAGLRWDGPIRP